MVQILHHDIDSLVQIWYNTGVKEGDDNMSTLKELRIAKGHPFLIGRHPSLTGRHPFIMGRHPSC